MLGFFSLMTGGRHHDIRVFERNQVENQLSSGWLVATQESFRIAGATLVFHPDNRRSLVFNGLSDGGNKAYRQSQCSSGRRAELDKVATIDPASLHALEELLGDRRGVDVQVSFHCPTSFTVFNQTGKCNN